MQRAFQTDWFGIKFESLGIPSLEYSKDSDFYRVFYSHFRSKYGSYSDLDANWRREKDCQFRDLQQLIGSSTRILSIGSGIGYLEFLLAQDENKRVTAIEPFADFSDWMGSRVAFHQGFFPTAISDFDFDFVFLSAVDYAMTNSEYFDLLSEIRSRIPSKLALTGLHVPSLAPRVLLQRMYSRMRNSENQGLRHWGYFRTLKEHENILKNVGYEVVAKGTHQASKNLWIVVA